MPLQVFDQTKYAISKLQKKDEKKLVTTEQIAHEEKMRGLRKSISVTNIQHTRAARGRNPSMANLLYKEKSPFKESFPIDSAGRSVRFTKNKNQRD